MQDSGLDPEISVIVPVYNAEKYLSQCIESIQNQTFYNLEILLINDGSTDRSGEICEEYASQDPRIRIFHQSNKGVCAARNKGLNLARGEYIGFVDNDDLLHPQMYELLLAGLKNQKAELAMAYCCRLEPHPAKCEEHYDSLPSQIIIKETAIIKMFGNSTEDFYFMAIWNKLYHRNILKGLSFFDGGAEDLVFMLEVYLKCKNIVLLEQPLYYWIQWPSSVSHKRFCERDYKVIFSYYRCLCILRQNSSKIIYSACLHKTLKQLLHKRFNSKYTKWHLPISRFSKKFITKYAYSYLINPHISMVDKLAIISMFAFPFIYSFYRKIKEHTV